MKDAISLRRRLHVKQNEEPVFGKEKYRNLGGNAENFSSLVDTMKIVFARDFLWFKKFIIPDIVKWY